MQEDLSLDDGLAYCHLNNRGAKHYQKRLGVEVELRGDMANYGYVDLPAHKAAYEGNVEALEAIFIVKHGVSVGGVPLEDKLGATPLHIAARMNQVDAIKWLIRYTTLSVLSTAHLGETPVHVAAALGHLECVKALLASKEKNLKPLLSFLQDKTGFTCLLLAIQKHHNNVFKYLLNALGPPSVNAINDTGITAAHVCASYGNVEGLKILSGKYKRLLHERAADGTTPAYFAAQEGQLEILKYLHEVAKCDLSIPSDEAADNLKPIHAAAQGGHTRILKYIVSKMGADAMLDPVPDGGTPLHFASSAGKLKTVRWLVNNDMTGQLIFAQDENGDTPAHDAARAGKVEVLKFLLENGADIMATNKADSTPYSNALSSNNPEMANLVVTFSTTRTSSGPMTKVVEETDNDEEDIMLPYDDMMEIDNEPLEVTAVVEFEEQPILPPQSDSMMEDLMMEDSMMEDSHEYATINEIEENKKRRSKKQKTREFSKSIQNALKIKRKLSKDKMEEEEYGEIGSKPRQRTNPLLKFRKGGDKKASTPATPPPTPATQSSDKSHQDQLAEILELDNVYTKENIYVTTNLSTDEQIKQVESATQLSLGSASSETTKKAYPQMEKWPEGFRLDDAIIVTEKDVPSKGASQSDRSSSD
jgi:ankyrin repeat protein